MSNWKTFTEDYRKISEERGNEYFPNFLKQLEKLEWDFAGRQIPTYPQPLPLPIEFRNEIAKSAEHLFSILSKISLLRLNDRPSSDLGRMLPVDPEVLEFIRTENHFDGLQNIVRIDAIVEPHSGQMKVLEINCGDPSGMGWNDALIHLQSSDSSIRAAAGNSEFKFDLLCSSLRTSVLGTYSRFCITHSLVPSPDPLVVLVCSGGANISSDFRNIAIEFSRLGSRVYIADPRELKLTGDGLLLRGERVDIIYRDMIEDYFGPSKIDGTEKILDAVRKNLVCFINPVSAGLCEFKNLITAMRLPEVQAHLSSAELKIIEKVVPLTKPLLSADLEFCRSQRSKLVLKPNSGFGGKGILIGNEISDSEWAKELQKLVHEDYVIQEFIDIPTLDLPIIEDGTYRGFSSRKINVSLWVHHGNFAGAYARASVDSVVNISNSGGFLSVVWI